mgnify:CR=1 FL=1
MNTILVVAELANEKLAMAGLEQLALARRLAPTGTVIALLWGADKAMAEALIARGALPPALVRPTSWSWAMRCSTGSSWDT